MGRTLYETFGLSVRAFHGGRRGPMVELSCGGDSAQLDFNAVADLTTALSAWLSDLKGVRQHASLTSEGGGGKCTCGAIFAGSGAFEEWMRHVLDETGKNDNGNEETG